MIFNIFILFFLTQIINSIIKSKYIYIEIHDRNIYAEKLTQTYMEYNSRESNI